tara:strand:+ start:1092 stop:1298 length:207 start_codon:yes stop_codon:yes gene_type:complete
MSNEKAKELALLTSFIIKEDVLGGTLFQTFDKAYELAHKFIDQYPLDTQWGIEIEYEDTIIDFLNKNK